MQLLNVNILPKPLQFLDFFNVWPFTTRKICPIAHNCLSRFKIFYKYKVNPKTPIFLSNWRNFAKCGHTGPTTQSHHNCMKFNISTTAPLFGHRR